jgi:hypothetical protein
MQRPLLRDPDLPPIARALARYFVFTNKLSKLDLRGRAESQPPFGAPASAASLIAGLAAWPLGRLAAWPLGSNWPASFTLARLVPGMAR